LENQPDLALVWAAHDRTRTNIIVRGVQPASRKLWPDFKIHPGGRDLIEGRGECIVSRSMSKRFKRVQIGGILDFGTKARYNYETSDFNCLASMTVSFRFGPMVMAVALLTTLAMGLFGGMLPALRAVRLDVISALREL